MIVSFDRNFIFFKTRKTGGTSIEMALAPFCGQRDIVAPIAMEDEIARIADGVVQARNFSDDRALMEVFAHAVKARDRTKCVAVVAALIRRGDFYNHMPATAARAKLPPAFWTGAFKFTIERHPYEKAVSRAWYDLAQAGAPPTEFDAFLARAVERGRIDNTAVYTIDNEIVVDEIIRQERIEEDFSRIAGRIGLLLPVELPVAKATSRLDRRPARDVLSPEQRRRIFEQCRRTFELCCYDP
jgi:hypothetical protein